jgi:quinolinate synthase
VTLPQAPPPEKLTLPQIGELPRPPRLTPEQISELQAEVRTLAAERGAVILAHNYQLPEIQDVADYVGDSLGLSRHAAKAEGELIVFCGVHFMAETASVLCPGKTVLIPDLRAGCSLASSIDAQQLGEWKQRYPDGVVVMYVNTSAAVKALTDYCCTSANAVAVVRHVYETQGDDTEILFGPDIWLGAYVEKELGRPMHVWDGECHVHAGIRPHDIAATRAAHPGADFLIHPECGCTTSVMEYVAAGDVPAEGVKMLSTGGMLRYAGETERELRSAREAGANGGGGDRGGAAREAVVATEVGMLYGLAQAAPDVRFIPANPEATCAFMKMITLPRLRDSLREGRYEVRVPDEVARRARVPIERMVAIG